MHLHEVENPLLEVVKHADPHWMEEVRLEEVAHNTGNMSKYIKFSLNMARREFDVGCLGVGIAERSMSVVIPPGVLVVRSNMISECILSAFAPKINMPLEMTWVAILWTIFKPCC
jgi:hypothetical protein